MIRPAEIDLQFAPARSALAVERVVGDDLLLLDPESGSTHVLNAIGRVFWSELDGRTTLEELAEDLAHAVGAPVDDLIEPVLGWARALGFNGLLDGVAPSEADLIGVDTAVSEGEPLPAFAGERLDGGERVRLPVLRSRRTVLVNWSFGCGFCLGMLDVLREALPLLDARGWDVALLVAGPREDVEATARTHGLASLVVLTAADDDNPFHDLGTPVAYFVYSDGIVEEPLAFGGAEVPAALRRHAGLAPVPVDHRAAIGEPDGDEEGQRYLALPPSAGVCAPSGSRPARTWTGIDTFRIGDLVVGIRAASSTAGQLVRQLLASAADDGSHRQPNYSVVLPGLEDAASRELNLLLQGDVVVVRSRSARRVVDALLAYLATHATAEEPDIWRIAAFPVVKDGRAALLPDELRSSLAQVQPRLTKVGLAMVDLPTAIVDTRTTELVIPRPTTPHDAEVASRLGPVQVRASELPPAMPGRYPLAAWLFPGADLSPEAGVTATSLALATAAVARPKNAALLDEVDALLHRLSVAVEPDLGALITKASEYLTAP